MILIRIETSAQPSIGFYLEKDQSDDAIDAFVRRACDGPHRWKRITEQEAKAIRDARPKPRVSAVVHGDATAAVDLGPVIEELARLHARCDTQEAATKDINSLLDRARVVGAIEIEEQ